jgi:hypothetical protein
MESDHEPQQRKRKTTSPMCFIFSSNLNRESIAPRNKLPSFLFASLSHISYLNELHSPWGKSFVKRMDASIVSSEDRAELMISKFSQSNSTKVNRLEDEINVEGGNEWSCQMN